MQQKDRGAPMVTVLLIALPIAFKTTALWPLSWETIMALVLQLSMNLSFQMQVHFSAPQRQPRHPSRRLTARVWASYRQQSRRI